MAHLSILETNGRNRYAFIHKRYTVYNVIFDILNQLFGYLGHCRYIWIHVTYKAFLWTSLFPSTSLVSFPMATPFIQTPFPLWIVRSPSTVIPSPVGLLTYCSSLWSFLMSYTTTYIFLSLTIACQRTHITNDPHSEFKVFLAVCSVYTSTGELSSGWQLFTLGLFLHLSQDAL